MKIGIVAPCPVPFTIGGVEKMVVGLQREINTNTSHQADIIKLPAKEHSFWELIDSYEAFSRLDLSNFDLVISSKYPAWMVSHPRHICYMQHRLRGLYDSYHFNQLPIRYETAHPDLLALQRLLDETPRRESLTEVFSRLRNLRYQHDVPQDAFQFPGPLIKQVLEYLDGVGLHPEAIEGYYAISQTVVERASYFPPGAAVKVVYHPSNLEDFRCGEFNYIFTASRLDGAKRIALLVEAMKFVPGNLELRIAGEGPDRSRLEAAAKDDPRIKFLGFRSDVDLIDDYAGALAVAFIPQAEDYGLITIEAMMSQKPVITTTDAGGPTEFVLDGKTGLCVPPEPQKIGWAIESIAQDRALAAKMGAAGRARVQSITWRETVHTLLGDAAAPPRKQGRRPARRKLTVATTFPIAPAHGGGQVRIFHLYKNLFPLFETELITLGAFNEKPSVAEIAPGLREIRIPKSPAHNQAENDISAEVEWFPITDVVFPKLAHLTPAYMEALERSTRDAEAVVAAHPYPLNAIVRTTKKPIWYEAQDVECLLKSDVIPKTPRGLDLIEEVRQIEARSCEQAQLIMVCSEADRDQLVQLYHVPQSKIHIVPNGVDSSQMVFVPRRRAQELKRALGCGSSFLALFIGSWHQPNLDAIEVILSLADQQPSVHFLILGSGCAAFAQRTKPANLGFFGVVDEETKALVMGAADLALNPMQNGSGTNLKMLDYAAAGIPILSTPIGLRGLAFRSEKEVFAAEIADFDSAINHIRRMPTRMIQEMTLRARRRTEMQFDWRNISRQLITNL